MLNTTDQQIDNQRDPIQAFWDWFAENSDEFFQIIQSHDQVEERLITKLGAQLNALHPSLYFLVGLEDDGKAHLYITPEGVVQHVAYAEKMVAAAPELPNWTFKALKPGTKKLEFEIRTEGLTFGKNNLQFYPIVNPNFPDKIDLMFVYDSFHPESYQEILNGTFLFLDSFLGEEVMINTVDHIEVRGPGADIEELIPLEKLPDYLNWREKEFVEKYQEITYDPTDDSYTGFEGTTQEDMPIISTINTTVLNWDHKASHPWILVIMNEYIPANESGFPDADNFDLMVSVEEKIEERLMQRPGFIFLGTETVNGIREAFFACRDFRYASEVMDEFIEAYADKLNMRMEFFKDRYWQSFEKYRQANHLED